jgi:excisionase family DNA binding protein
MKRTSLISLGFFVIVYYLKIMYSIFNSSKFMQIVKGIPMDRLLTTEEVAEILRIEPVTVRRLILRGELTAYRIAGEYRFAPADLEAFLASQRVVITSTTSSQLGDKFTDQSRKVLALASEEARKYHHTGVGTEHLVLALLTESEGIVASVFDQFHIQEAEIRKEIEALHPEDQDHAVPSGMIGLTIQGKATIEKAVQEAQSLGHHYIGTEHLLLGILREEGLGGQVLLRAGMILETTREAIQTLLVTNTQDPA